MLFRSEVPVDTVLNLSAFNLDQALERRPTFLEPEYPFEWTGVFQLEPGRYEVSLEEGPDPMMSLVVVADQGTDEESLNEGAESCVRLYAESAELLHPGDKIPLNKHVNLQLQSEGRKSFLIETDKEYPISFNGKMKFTLKLSLELSIEEIKGIIIKDKRTISQLKNKTPKKIIIVPSKIINIVY